MWDESSPSPLPPLHRLLSQSSAALLLSPGKGTAETLTDELDLASLQWERLQSALIPRSSVAIGVYPPQLRSVAIRNDTRVDRVMLRCALMFSSFVFLLFHLFI